MRLAIDEVHSKEDAILKRKIEIAEMQKALSDSHLAIYDEKNTVNTLRLEYEELLKVENADMKRIRELESLSEEVKKQDKKAAASG